MVPILGHTMKAFMKSLEDFWFQSWVILKMKFMKEKILEIHLQKLREEKEEAVTSAFRVGPHSGTGTA